MEFKYNVEEKLGCNEEGIIIIDSSSASDIKHSCFFLLKDIIDKMGLLSAKACNSKTIVTTYDKFFSSNNRMYVKCDKNIVIGFIKVGLKTLFLRENEEVFFDEYSVLCVLDFYIHESLRRRRFGKDLFEKMLFLEKTIPEKLAYDCITKPLKKFLNKHYKLDKIIPQTNNFTIYQEFFIQNKNFLKSKEYLNNQSNNSNENKDLIGKIANAGRSLVCTTKQNKEFGNNEKMSYSSSNALQDSDNLIGRVKSLDNNKDVKSINEEKHHLSKNQVKSFPKSTDFAERKNFAFYYLNDFSKPDGFSNLRGNCPINNNYQNFSFLNNPVIPHEIYFYDKYSLHQKEIEKTKERIKKIENKIPTHNSQFYSYNKREDYATLWDKTNKNTNLLSLLERKEGMYNRKVEIHPINPFYR